MYYSAKNKGFFPSLEDYPNFDLSDAVEITSEDHLMLLLGETEGKEISHDENGVPKLIEREVSAPETITRSQGKAALMIAGLWGGVETFVESMGNPIDKALALVALNDTTHWQRSSPFLNSAAAALGLTDEDLDNLFIQAAEIEL